METKKHILLLTSGTPRNASTQYARVTFEITKGESWMCMETENEDTGFIHRSSNTLKEAQKFWRKLRKLGYSTLEEATEWAKEMEYHNCLRERSDS